MQPNQFYQEQINAALIKLAKVKRLALTVSLARLGVFLLILFLAYTFSDSSLILGITVVIGFALFLFLVSLYTNLKQERIYFEFLIDLNKKELEALAGIFGAFNEGKEYKHHEHSFSEDMDLFGKGSMFQSINRSATVNGEKKLAELLGSNHIEFIEDKQKAINELAAKALWRQNFRVNAALIETQVEPQRIVEWLKNFKKQMPSFAAALAFFFPLISLLFLLLASLSIIEWTLLLIPMMLGLLISGVFLMKVNRINEMASRLASTFQQYSKLLSAVEEEKFESEWLIQQQKKTETEHKKASLIFAEFGKDLNSLDQRKNIFFALFANGFALWDLRFSVKIERWILTNEKMVESCFDGITFFDAYGSLANYAFNHPDFNYPNIVTDQKSTIASTHLGHPLLQKEKRISNNFEINKDEFFIITGANMAGKSTFLRTVGISIVMANCGLPVCASIFSYSPIKLISSMRSSDALHDDESYFFAELKRLKFIVDEIDLDRYFIILDEILKGTNSKDKEEGSKKFVQRLVNSKSTGIIATHDLSLCQLENELSQIKNHYFDAEIVNNELHFDYTFKNGICKNMNASFLLKKLGIIE